MKDNTWDWYAT